jgi:hypothetical protein
MGHFACVLEILEPHFLYDVAWLGISRFGILMGIAEGGFF